MVVKYYPNYSTYRTGNGGEDPLEVSLDNSQEEREEVAEKVCEALMSDGEINLDRVNVTLTHLERSNCQYSEQHDETYCSEDIVEFDFDIAPMDYLDVVVAKVVEQVDDAWDVNKMSPLLYLERALTEVGYEGKELAQLTEVVEPFREEWKYEILGEDP